MAYHTIDLMPTQDGREGRSGARGDLQSAPPPDQAGTSVQPLDRHAPRLTSSPARDRPSPAPLAELLDLLLQQLTTSIVATLTSELVAAQPQPQAWSLLNVHEAAAYFQRSTRWVRQQAKRGQLPFVRLDGGALAFELEDIQAFARARRIAADDPTTLADRSHTRRNAAPRKRSRRSEQATDLEV